MNSYTVTYRHAHEYVDASDTDMAAIKAAEIIAQNYTEEQRGELLSITLHAQTGDLIFYTHAGEQEVPTVSEAKPSAPAPAKLPSRRQGGLTLSYSDGDLTVCSFGYSASLAAAWHEGELSHDKGRHEEKQLSAKQMKIVDEWMNCEGDYYEQNGWATWSEINEAMHG